MLRYDKHLIIAGAGRAGTTFLIQLLTRLGCDTGMKPYEEPIDRKARAGCEWKLDEIHEAKTREEIQKFFRLSPWVIKSPDLSFWLKALLFGNLIEVGHVLIPVRDHYEAAMSRIDAGLQWPWTGADFESQSNANDQALGRIVEACVLAEIPFTFLKFPKLIQDPDYCWGKLQDAIAGFGGAWKPLYRSDREGLRPWVPFSVFRKEFLELADPEMPQHTHYQMELRLCREEHEDGTVRTGRHHLIYPAK